MGLLINNSKNWFNTAGRLVVVALLLLSSGNGYARLYIYIENKLGWSGYVADAEIWYDDVHQEFSSFPVAQSRQLALPVNAGNVRVKAWAVWGETIFDITLTPPSLTQHWCVEVGGTTLHTQWRNIDCSSVGFTNPIDTDNDGLLDNVNACIGGCLGSGPYDWDDDNDGVLDTIDIDPLNNQITTESHLPLDSGYRGVVFDLITR